MYQKTRTLLLGALLSGSLACSAVLSQPASAASHMSDSHIYITLSDRYRPEMGGSYNGGYRDGYMDGYADGLRDCRVSTIDWDRQFYGHGAWLPYNRGYRNGYEEGVAAGTRDCLYHHWGDHPGGDMGDHPGGHWGDHPGGDMNDHSTNHRGDHSR